MKTIITFGKTRLPRLFLCFFITILSTSFALATTRNWNGGTSSDWNTAANWSPSGVPAAGDILNIGVSATFTNQPVIMSTPTSPASVTLGLKQAVTLTVNSGFTLNVGGPVNQAASSSGYGTLTNTLAGAGAITCTSLNVGDNSTYLLTLGSNLVTLASTIASLHVTGNVAVNSTNNGILFVGTCYNNAKFSLQGGTTTIDGTIFTANTAGGILSVTTASPIFTVDMPSGSALNPVLQLTNASAINTASVAGSIDFYNNSGGTGTCAVYYSGTSQTVYTNTTACLDNSPTTYQYLIFSGSGTKTVGTATGSTLSVNNSFTNSTTTTDLSAFNPTVTIGNNWVNAGNVTGGSGNITAANLQNISGTVTLATGATTIGSTGIQLSGGGVTCGGGTVTDNGTFQNTGGALICGSGSLIFNGDYQNTAGTFTASTGTVYFSGSTQALYDNTAAGTTFNKVTFNGTGTSTISAGTGNFSVSASGTLTMTSPAKLVAGSTSVGGAGYLTLLSTGTSTATVAAISGSSTITGAVNVQRFVSGGSSNFRGYRLLSSPVNVNNLTAISYPSNIGYLGLTYLNVNTSIANGILTAGPSGATNGFSVTNTNPLIYLYDESMTTSNNSYVSGKNVGITAITGASGSPAYSVTTLSVSTSTSGVTVPVGNSILLYYVGSTASSVITSGRTPDNAITTATGYLNQGNVPVVFWKTSSTSIPYHSNGGYLPGLNQVGNPYASTISLDQLYTDNSTISPIFWELNDQNGGAYISYNASSGTTSNTRAGKYIVSGQGFIMAAITTSQTITFKEDQKVAYPASFTSSTTPALLLSMPPNASLPNLDSRVYASIDTTAIQPGKPALAGLHLQLITDSLPSCQTGIYFNSNWSDSYNPGEDAVDISPVTSVHLSSFSSDGSQVEINELGNYTGGKRIKLYTCATHTGTYDLSLADIVNIDTGANNIFLVDKKMNDSLDMVRYKSYAFTIVASDTNTYGANRFVLAIDPKFASPDSLPHLLPGKKPTVNTNVLIYPNPSTSIVNISLGVNAPANYTEDIYDTSGALVKRAAEASATFTEDISNYKLGVYIIELKDNNGNLLGKSKFVKTN